MPEEMRTIPPRVNELEQRVHTIVHRVAVLEEAHRETPHRLTKVEIAVERLPRIDERLGKLEDQVSAGFNKVLGALGLAGAIVAAINLGPVILKMLGA